MKAVYSVIAILLLAGGAWFTYTTLRTITLSCSTLDPKPRIVAFGDSLVTGYGAVPGEDAFSVLSTSIGVPIRTLGVDGDTSARALARIDSVILEDPDIVLVLLGGNDALQRVPLLETEANLGEILSTLNGAGIRTVLIGVIGGFPRDPYAPMFESLGNEHVSTVVPNILSGILGRDEYMSDAIHPNAVGYARIAERLVPVLERVCALHKGKTSL